MLNGRVLNGGRAFMSLNIARITNPNLGRFKLAVCLFLAVLWLSCGLGPAGASVEPDVGVPAVMVSPQAEPFLEAAQREMSEGDAAAALAAVAEGLVRHPGDPRLLERRADILATQPAFRQEALELYQRLLAARPADLDLKVKLARIWLALRQPFKAEALFQEVLAAEPANFQANLGLGRIYLATVFYTMAARHFAQARAARPESREALEGWREASSLITTQIQTMGNVFEDAGGFSAQFPVERVLAIPPSPGTAWQRLRLPDLSQRLCSLPPE